ncbi:hypothetical protein Dsin_005653 [Dipteronia sinensis]|uniref:Uncharacterized protein n=1 Tax=Dipteronia sinensis TaxID=43782 RepID=A0AAE0AWV3_9ROSI|nr:hypothetical protein Dsin_005653 [Dipteronia sinensis]
MSEEVSKMEHELGPNHQEHLGGNISAFIHKGLPPKLKYLGIFTVDISNGGTSNEQTMLDLGSEINLMPSSVYKRLKLGELKHTSMSLVLADQSS